jgi:hypothetical protein
MPAESPVCGRFACIPLPEFKIFQSSKVAPFSPFLAYFVSVSLCCLKNLLAFACCYQAE